MLSMLVHQLKKDKSLYYLFFNVDLDILLFICKFVSKNVFVAMFACTGWIDRSR